MMLKSSSTIRFQLSCLVIASVLPVWLVSGFLVSQAYSAKRSQVNNAMLTTARSLTMVVDRELTNVQAALAALGTSPSFAAGDLGSVQRQATLLLKSYPGADIIVADVTGQQLVNSFLPYGTALPKRKNTEAVRRIFATGRPVVSDLFYGALTQRPLIGVDVPVLVAGKVEYDLAMTFPVDSLTAVLLNQHLPPDQYASILDNRQVVVARSRNQLKYVGKKAHPMICKALALAPDGVMEGKNLEDVPVFTGFSRSAASGWTVVVGVTKASGYAELYRWMGWAMGGAVVISLSGMLLAAGYARRIANDIHSLVRPALAIGRGESASAAGGNSIRETREVATALSQASDLIRANRRELLESERRLKRYAQRLIEQEEDLREKISLELHDDIGQELAALGLNLAHINTILQEGCGSELKSTLDDSRQLTKKIICTVRNLMVELRPSQLEDVGPAAAIRSYSDLYALRTGLAVALQIDPQFPRLPLKQEIALFRIFQEALNNIVLHAAAKRVAISLGSDGGQVRLRITDDGRGLLPLEAGPQPTESGWGLIMMRERAELAGGSLDLQAEPGGGTTITVAISEEL